ncbi:MAG TPA: ATP-binding protein, partial [Phycisphaerae bacterium]|nr:ATP-binding protein [Phycisphaerae bacterium]
LQNRCEPGYRINTDSEFVVQILANLIENACKYSTGAADPRIWLTAAPRDEGGIVFEVEDRGAGVALADRKAVFKPFRRSSDARAHAAGMGLGLTLSRYWAACLGGRLELQRGEHDAARFTRFSLSLPPGDASTAPALRPAPAR